MRSPTEADNRSFYPEAFFIGFTLIGAQIILLREFLLVFYGNELVIGLLFSLWMITSALGAYVGKYFSSSSSYKSIIRFLLLFICTYPILAAYGIETLRNVIFHPGEMISFYGIFIFGTLILFPLCFAGGLAFSLVNISARHINPKSLQDCYIYESLGSVSGGLVVGIFFIYYLNTNNFNSLEYLALINLIYFGIYDFRRRMFLQSFLFLMGAIGIMLLNYSTDINKVAKSTLFEDQVILGTEETPFGNLVVTKTESQLNFFSNGVLLFSTEDVVVKEEDVHYTMLQRPEAKSVLLIGGGLTGTTSEILKYPKVEQIDYVEQNKAVFRMINEFTSFMQSPKISAIHADPVLAVNQTTSTYDAVIINQPPPSSAQFNRFYTIDFFQKLKRLLNDSGVVSTRISSSQQYLSEEEIKLHSSIYNSLKQVFKSVLVVPGNHYYFIASESALEINYNQKLLQYGISNSYVSNDYINDDLIKFRSDQTMASYLPEMNVNRDFHPIVYLIYIQHWLKYFGITFWLIPVICLLFIAFYLVYSRLYSTSMFVSGFTGAATEVVLIIAFQILFGYVYLYLGFIITVFMAGLAAGAWFSRKCKLKDKMKMQYFVQLFSGIYIASIAFKIYLAGDLTNSFMIKSAFLVMMVIVAMLVGFQYGLSVHRSTQNTGRTIARVYTADLLGSALGSFLVAVWLIPEYGLYQTLLFLSCFHFLTLFILVLKSKMKYF